MSPAPSYHARTHMPGGTDPIPVGGHGDWIELDLINGFTGGPLEYRHAPGSPGDDSWELEWRGHIEGPSGTYCGVLPAADRPPSDKYGITEGEDSDTGDGIVVEWFFEASTGNVFITYPVGGSGSGSGAPDDATYITQTANGSLSNEQALSALSTGLVKVTTTTGVLSTATEGTDYWKPGGTDVALGDGGTGTSLSDPNADRIMFWDDSAGHVEWLTAGTNLSISGTTINATSGGGAAFVGCRAYQTTTQSITNSTWTAVLFDTESYDTDGFHDTSSNKDRFTVPTSMGGKYHIAALGFWSNSSTAGVRLMRLTVNGSLPAGWGFTAEDGSAGAGVGGMGLQVSDVLDLAAGDIVRTEVFQTSGGSLNVTSCFLAIAKLG